MPTTPITLQSGTTQATFIPFGATLTRLRVDGRDFIARLSSPAAYLGDHPYVGTIVGRVANRIREGRFSVDGQSFQVATNENGNTLHGGPKGFESVVWDVAERGSDRAVFRHISPAGHQDWPGELDVAITVEVAPGRLTLSYAATTTAPTPVSLTHHTYFALPGVARVDDVELRVGADTYTAVDGELLPTDYAVPVAGSGLDFRQASAIGGRFIDTSFDIPGEGLREHVRLMGPGSALRVLSDLPAVQVYTGEALAEAGLSKRGGLAVEPQYAPDLVNTGRGEEVILRPGEAYRHRIVYEVGERVEG